MQEIVVPFLEKTLENLPEDHPDRAAIARLLVSGQRHTEVTTFSDEASKALISDGALVYTLEGTTITTQRELQRAKNKPSFWFVVDGGERLVGRPSRLTEVAIYPDPKRFFVEDTGNKDVDTQDKMVQKDGESLRKRLKVGGIDVIIPDEASALTEVTFKHLDETGAWLFSEKYAKAHSLDFIYGRTKNPTNESGSDVADVGHAKPVDGLHVYFWDRGNGNHHVHAVRLVVPKR